VLQEKGLFLSCWRNVSSDGTVLTEGRSMQLLKRRGLNYQQLVTLDVLGVFTVVGLKIGLFNYITS